jgi:peptidoglycan hydrolase CwlO-like protein
MMVTKAVVEDHTTQITNIKEDITASDKDINDIKGSIQSINTNIEWIKKFLEAKF